MFAVILSVLLVVQSYSFVDAIVGGSKSSINAAPYAVQIEAPIDGEWSYTCAGVALDAFHVLTAANCVGDPSTRVPFDVATTRVRAASSARGGGNTVRDVRAVFLHPDWRTFTPRPDIEYGDADVAVLKLVTALPATVQFASLPASGTKLAAETALSVASWGVGAVGSSKPADFIESAVFGVVDLAACNNIYKKDGVTVSNLNFCVRATPKKALCTGDSGAGLVSQSKVFGIYSWGSCGEDDNPSVIVNLASAKIRSFIDGAKKK